MSTQTSRARRIARFVAWGALILSFPVWGAALLAPFLPFSIEQRAMFAAACIATGEILFWGAGLYLGADVIARFRQPRGHKRDEAGRPRADEEPNRTAGR